MGRTASWATRIVLSFVLAFGMVNFAGGGGSQALASEPTAYAQPGPDDFKVWNDTIQGLKDSYVASLTEEQKKDIRLVIPDEINGQKITTIGNSAFYSYTNPGLTFTLLDFSQVTSLQAIGSNAFRYASKLTGDLVLPDTVTEIGDSAFADCGFNGTLHLPNNSSFTLVPGQAFLNTPFTGTLSIPSNVQIIQRKAFQSTAFSGELNIPEGVTELHASAFTDCENLTAVTIPSTMDFKKRDTDSGHHFRGCTNLARVEFAADSSVTTLFKEAFGGCSSLRMIELPDSITSIDGAAFRASGLQTVYLPQSASFAGDKNVFLITADNAVAVCKDKASYEAYRAQLPTGNQKYLGYPVTVTFDAGSEGANPPAIERLVNQPFNRVKDNATGVWAVDGSYVFPSLGSEMQKTPWCYDAEKTKQVEETTTVSEATLILYAGAPALADPVLVPTNVWAPYDGEEHYLKIEASHPLVKDPGEAQEGDYAFYYLWRHWDSTNKKWNTIKQGFFDDTHALKDVADTGYYGVYVYFAQVQSGKWKILTKETKGYKQLQAVITAVSPTINPQLSPDAASNLAGFPGLAVSDGDTPGTLTWKAGQTLAEGTNSYTWTFTPDPPAPGKKANYTTETGTIDLRVAGGKVMHSVTFDSAGGTTFDPLDLAFGETLPAGYVPAKDQHVFVGWYRDAELTKPFLLSDRVAGDMTLHARWEKRAATVDTGAGDVVVDGEKIDKQTQAVDIVRDPDVKPEHQQTLQTSNEVAGSGAPAGFFELNLTVDGEVVEKATFSQPLPVEVAFPVEERTRYSVAHLRHDNTVEVIPAKANLQKQSLMFATGSLSPFMVLAKKLCDVTFDSAGGTAVASLHDVEAGSLIAAPTAPTRSGFTFVGWSRDAAGTQLWDFARDTVQGDLALHAVWNEEKKPDPVDPDPVVPGPDADPGPDTDPEDPNKPADPENPGGTDNPENPENPGDDTQTSNGPGDSSDPVDQKPQAGTDGDTGDQAASVDPGNSSAPKADAKPLPATALPMLGDAPRSFLAAVLVLIASLSACIALRARRRRA